MDLIELRGLVWGGSRRATGPGVVRVAPGGRITEVDRSDAPLAGPPERRVIRGAWVGPAIVDAHVHCAFGPPEDGLAAGVGALRDLGAPLERAKRWRALVDPVVAIAGEVVTAPGGYPTQSWGADGFGIGVSGPEAARAAVARLERAGVDVVKLALEPAGGAPVPDLSTCRAVVTSAHEHGLAVVCHALSEQMVLRALDAGVDELAHTPTQRLGAAAVERVVASGITVTSTLHTLSAAGSETACLENAADLVAAGVRLVYGTDLGNAATAPGISVDELEALATCGLGREGALVSATRDASSVAGLAGRVDVEVRAGARTVIVVLAADPLDDPTAWSRPIAVVAGGRVVGSPSR